MTRSTGGVASHATAARVHRLWTLDHLDWVTVPAAVHRDARLGLRLHREDMLADDAEWLGELRITTVARTCLDLSRRGTRLAALMGLDSALRQRLIGADDLADVSARLTKRQLALAALADGRSESPLETGWRLATHDVGIILTPQVEVAVDGAGFRIDLGDEDAKVGLECDGRDVHSAPAALYTDRQRANALAAAGWTLIRATWRDLSHRRQPVLAALAAALSRH